MTHQEFHRKALMNLRVTKGDENDLDTISLLRAIFIEKGRDPYTFSIISGGQRNEME